MNAKRRVLLRGSLSVPVVLTISPGAAAAAASAVNCVSDVPPPGEVEASASLSQNYYRTPVTATKTKDYPGWYAITTPTGKADYLINFTSGDVRKLTSPVLPNRMYTNDTIQRYVVRLYNNNGTVKDVAPDGFPQVIGNEAGWASMMCLASFPAATG